MSVVVSAHNNQEVSIREHRCRLHRTARLFPHMYHHLHSVTAIALLHANVSAFIPTLSTLISTSSPHDLSRASAPLLTCFLVMFHSSSKGLLTPPRTHTNYCASVSSGFCSIMLNCSFSNLNSFLCQCEQPSSPQMAFTYIFSSHNPPALPTRQGFSVVALVVLEFSLKMGLPSNSELYLPPKCQDYRHAPTPPDFPP